MKISHINPLAWDSNHFGFNIGSLHLDNSALNTSDLDRFKLIYVFSRDLKTIDLKGFACTYQEDKVVFRKTLLLQDTQKYPHISFFKGEYLDKDQLYELAFESGKCSRFLLDKNFSEEAFKKLYSVWVDNAINFTFSDGLLLWREGNDIVGFLNYRIEKEVAQVGLFAVSRKFQGQGMGTALLSFLESILLEQGILSLFIPTQLQNKLACSFYKKNGYDIDSVTNIKHYWKV
jgi:dTDP-4-amino-4,6-dideoxy-D-galactose acyltransferase